MFTRCPDCLTVHPLNASLLAHANGKVRCGNCDQEFQALDSLFDHWPDSDTPCSLSGDHPAPPLLGSPDFKSASSAVSQDRETVGGRSGIDAKTQHQEPADSRQGTWLAVLLVLILASLANLAWTFREPLLDKPEVRSFLEKMGALEPVKVEAFRDIPNLHVVSRDLHRHPTRAGMLALSVTFVNRSSQAQAYPGIELTLSDSANQPLAQRLFLPVDYLPQGPVAPGLLEPNIHVPLLLEFADPGLNATGFELKFR